MPLLWVAIAIALMLVLVTKLDAFFALIITALVVGVLEGMDPLTSLRSVLNGIGATMGSVALILVFGAMLGKLLDESGAAQAITLRLVGRFGRHLGVAMAAAGLLVGLPMLYNAGFLVLIPIVYAVASATGLPLVRVGLPLASALSVTHGFLPPHPAPTFMSFTYGADPSRTLAFGLVAAVPACLIGGVLLARVVRVRPQPAPAASPDRTIAQRTSTPGLWVSIAAVLLPVLLMLAGALVDAASGTTGIDPFRPDFDFARAIAGAVPDPGTRAIVIAFKFLGNANVAMMIAVLVALYTLGVRRGRTMPELMRTVGAAASGIAMILLVIAAGGALSQVLRDGGVAAYVVRAAAGLHLDPLLLAFSIAALLRLAVGSATVAGMTAAGLLAPTVAASGVRPELMVLATGAGSLMFSHFNDTGFWMFKEYFHLSIGETFATWSVMEMVVALVGLGMVLAMRAVG